jgi:RecB family endonuclease NucS
MAIEIGIWRIDKELTPVEYSKLDLESRLQDILCNDISIADPNLMVIGREVLTAYGKRIDILAINRDGHLVVIELKRDRTPRDIVAQTLEYGSWIRNLENDEIAQIYSHY